VHQINDDLENQGFPTEVYNKVKYGAFTTLESLKEDARFMTEDEEGLKQLKGWQRPITFEILEQFFWNQRNSFVKKISCLNEEEKTLVIMVMGYAYLNENYFEWSKSKYANKDDLRNYNINLI